MVLYLQSAPSCLAQLSLNQTAVTEATLVVLPTCVPQLRLLSIKQTKVHQLYRHIWLVDRAIMFASVFSHFFNNFSFYCFLVTSLHLVLPGQGRVSFGRAVQLADSQPGWDRCDRKLSGAPRHPPCPVVPQFGGNFCSGWQSGPADHLRFVNGKETLKNEQTGRVKQNCQSVVNQTLKGFCFPPRSKVDSADPPWTPLCDRQRVVIPL